MYTMKIERLAWGGWQNCYRLYSDLVELIVTTDVGPRIIACHFMGEPNLFYVDDSALGQTASPSFQLYGGHRFWLAPEHSVRTYQPDNYPVDVKFDAGEAVFMAPIEAQTGVQKTLTIQFISPTKISVTHQVHNHNLWNIDCSLWGLTVMGQGGCAIMPLPQRGTHGENLLPNTRLVLWAYSDMSDARWTWGREYVLLQQDVNAVEPQKIGGTLEAGWLAYVNQGTLFVKEFPYEASLPYPDYACNAEIFTNNLILELESLSHLQTINAQTSASHTEIWHLMRHVPTPATDADVREHILPLLSGLNK